MSGSISAISSKQNVQQGILLSSGVERDIRRCLRQAEHLSSAALKQNLQNLHTRVEEIANLLGNYDGREEVADDFFSLMQDMSCLETRVDILAKKAARASAPAASAAAAPAKKTVTTTPAAAPAKKAEANVYAEIEAELLKRSAALLKLKGKELEASFLHYEGLNPLETRLKIVRDMEKLEKDLSRLVRLCETNQHERAEAEIRDKYKFTVHSEFPEQFVNVIKNCPSALKQAFQKAKEKGRLDEFLVKGFCDPTQEKAGGGDYDIEACLEAKYTQWSLWAQEVL